MDLNETLNRLEAAKGDPNALALATIDIVLSTYEPGLTVALEAAAVPHWFDEPTVRALLGDTTPEGTDWFDQLVHLTVVERFSAHHAWNVHEVTRLALRNRLAAEHPDRFRMLSERAASLVDGDDPAQVIEQVYHRLSFEPDEGADDLRRLWKKWDRAGKLQPLQALARNLDELCNRNLLVPRARAYALVALSVIREERIGLAAWEKMVHEAFDLMQKTDDEVGMFDAYSLLGRLLRQKGQFGDALSEYENARKTLDRRMKRHPDDTELVLARADLHVNLGRTLKSRGQLQEALTEFETSKDIRQRLVEMKPDDAFSRYDLADAYTDIADVLLPSSRSGEAESHYSNALTIMKGLDNREWGERLQQDIGRIELRLGDVFDRRGNLGGALNQYEISEDIFRRLTGQDPEHLGWKHDFAQIQIRIAIVAMKKRQLDEADRRLTIAREIYTDLAERDPGNHDPKRDLGDLSSMFAVLRQQQDRWGDSAQEYLQAEKLLLELSKADPARAEWKYSLATAQNGLGDLYRMLVDGVDDTKKVGYLGSMVQKFQAARDNIAELVDRDPGNTEWQLVYAWSIDRLASAVETAAKQLESGLKFDVQIELSAETLFERAVNGYASSAVIFERLSLQAPDDTDFKRNFSRSSTRAAGVLEKLGRPDEALMAYRRALAAAEELTLINPTNTVWAEELVSVKSAIARLEGVDVTDKDNSKSNGH